MKGDEPKLCVGASSGGHMAELRGLMEEARGWPIQPSLYITTLGLERVERGASHHAIGECDRNHILRALRVLLLSINIVVRERPSLVITTGSMPLAIFSLVARAFGARIIWIDSISQIDSLSASGRLVKPFADRFYVQWPELAHRYPGCTYAGELV